MGCPWGDKLYASWHSSERFCIFARNNYFRYLSDSKWMGSKTLSTLMYISILLKIKFHQKIYMLPSTLIVYSWMSFIHAIRIRILIKFTNQ